MDMRKILSHYNNEILAVPASNLFSCLKGADVIKNAALNYLESIRNLISAPLSLYNVLYLETLHRFAEFCQSMPKDKDSTAYSLLIFCLKRCVFTLKIRRKYLLPPNADIETVAEQEPQWTYAVFLAGLFYQLHYIQQDRQIYVKPASGEPPKCWDFSKGGFYAANVNYSVEWVKNESVSSIEIFMKGLVNHLVPAPAMQWLAQNAILYRLWLEAVIEVNTDNVLLKIVQEANNALEPRKQAIAKLSEANESHPETSNTANQALENNAIEPVDINPIESLLIYLSEFEDVSKDYPHWLRVKRGLFINNNVLQEFVSRKTKHESIEHFIEAVKSSLVEEEGQYCISYSPSAFEDCRVFDGIILNEAVLSAIWKDKNINTEFQPAITL